MSVLTVSRRTEAGQGGLTGGGGQSVDSGQVLHDNGHFAKGSGTLLGYSRFSCVPSGPC